MDISNIDFSNFFGKSIGFFDPTMNGGKTRALVKELDRARRTGHHVLEYNSSHNTRERNSIVINGEQAIPAKSLFSVPELRADVEQRMLKPTPHDPTLSWKRNVIGIDEANLFTLSPLDAEAMIDFLQWGREQSSAIFMSGLTHDFRHREFGYLHTVLPYVSLRISQNPVCMKVLDQYGARCQSVAMHTQRVWHKDFVSEQGLESLCGQEEPFRFVDKDGTPYLSEYIAAPFFDKTMRIEQKDENRPDRIKYLPVCTDCSRLPYKSETFQIYNTLVRGDHTFGFLGQPELTAAVVNFLVEEKWAKREENGLIVPVPFYRQRVGGYAPCSDGESK